MFVKAEIPEFWWSLDGEKPELNRETGNAGYSMLGASLEQETCRSYPPPTRFMSEMLITGALWHIASPGPVDCTVSRQQAGRIVALPASVGDGSGKRQPIMDQDLCISWSSGVSTGDH